MRPIRWLKLANLDIRLTLESARRARRGGRRPRIPTPLPGVERLETRNLLSAGAASKAVPVPPPGDHGAAPQQPAAPAPAQAAQPRTAGQDQGDRQTDGAAFFPGGGPDGNGASHGKALGHDNATDSGNGNQGDVSPQGKALGLDKNGNNDNGGDNGNGNGQSARFASARSLVGDAGSGATDGGQDGGGGQSGEAPLTFVSSPEVAAPVAQAAGARGGALPVAAPAAPTNLFDDETLAEQLAAGTGAAGAAAEPAGPTAAAGAALGVASFSRDAYLYGRLDQALRSVGAETLADPSPGDRLDRLFLEIWDDDQLLFPDAVPHIDDTLFPESRPAPLDQLPLPEAAPLPVPGSMGDGQSAGGDQARIEIPPPATAEPAAALAAVPLDLAPPRVVVPAEAAPAPAARPTFQEAAAAAPAYRPRHVYTVGACTVAFLVALGLNPAFARRAVDAGRRAGDRLRKTRRSI
jgi:hypothetical protein